MKSWWRDMLGEAAPRPPAILTEAEAIERLYAYGTEHGEAVVQPSSQGLHRHLRDAGNRAAGFHYVYEFAFGTGIPVTFVEMDAHTGEVLSWGRGLR